MTTTQTIPCTLSASTLVGDDVCDPSGECIGTVKEIMLDTTHGRIMYAVVSVGGFLGLGNKLFAVPWDALRVDTEKECLIMNADKDRLKDAPGFDKDSWPNFADPEFHRGHYAFYSVRPYWG